MNIGPREIAVIVGLLLVLAFARWVAGKIKNRDNGASQATKQ